MHNMDMDKINPILQKFPDTVDGPALYTKDSFIFSLFEQ